MCGPHDPAECLSKPLLKSTFPLKILTIGINKFSSDVAGFGGSKQHLQSLMALHVFPPVYSKRFCIQPPHADDVAPRTLSSQIQEMKEGRDGGRAGGRGGGRKAGGKHLFAALPP